ncbi:hypothetical protein GB937_007042 [Aspergillus fischeri]|nr:hypothetical protein GB937_007042 [Aspergillus fischeri]
MVLDGLGWEIKHPLVLEQLHVLVIVGVEGILAGLDQGLVKGDTPAEILAAAAVAFFSGDGSGGTVCGARVLPGGGQAVGDSLPFAGEWADGSVEDDLIMERLTGTRPLL